MLAEAGDDYLDDGAGADWNTSGLQATITKVIFHKSKESAKRNESGVDRASDDEMMRKVTAEFWIQNSGIYRKASAIYIHAVA